MFKLLGTIVCSAFVVCGPQPELDFVTFVRERGVDPTTLIVQAMDAHSLVFVGDSHLAAEPKEILVKSIETLESGTGVDFVVLEVSSTYQKAIDDYLSSSPEDTSILIKNPATLRAHWGVSADYLSIYRSVWKINQSRQFDSRIKIIAADHPNWPPPEHTPANETAAIMSARDEAMFNSIEGKILIPHPGAKTLVFMGTFHGAKAGVLELIYDVGIAAHLYPIGRRINDKFPGIYFSVMVDGSPELEEFEKGIKSYGFGPYFDFLFLTQPAISTPSAVFTDASFDFVTTPYYNYEDVFWHDVISFRDQFDGYVYLGKARPITLIEP